jgi:uncharacterized protein YjbI with pentapeptide repeats
MSEIQIVTWYDANTVLWKGEAEDLRAAVIAAVASDANLQYANLQDANLQGANLQYANLQDANLQGANLQYANLQDANLQGAKLQGANLQYANLQDAKLQDAKDLRLPTGETWHEYLTETVPALLTAGGQPLESFAEHFACHSWENCPMAHAFNTHDLSGVPVLLRPRAEQFIQFFDAKQIPWPLPTKADLAQQAPV